MARTNWVYINISAETRDNLRRLVEDDTYFTMPTMMRWLVDQEMKRRGLVKTEEAIDEQNI